MSNDLELRTRLTADASGLADALRTGERSTQGYVRSVEQVGAAARGVAAAEREAASQASSAGNARMAFLDSLREQVRLYGKSTEEVLRYRAAQAGVTQAAEPLIQQLQQQRQAQQAAAEAAREEAAAQREATLARKSAEAAQQAFLASLRDQVELQGRSGGDVLRYRAQQLGVGPEAEQLISRYEASMGRLGAQSRETAQAMRMLPAQITDIGTSLASGMPLWLVAIQQGGQIKDSFGGLGPMFTALRSAISPASLALSGVGLAAGAVAIGFYKALEEVDAYNRSIVMSGNYAGVTAGRLEDMARRVSQATGTQGQAAETLAALVSTGKVANDNLERFAATTQRLQQVVGINTAETVKNFEDLGRAPLEKTLQLNQAYGYLTTATYAQIKALMEQRRVEEAGEVAQKAYSDAMAQRTARLEDQLGTVQKAALATKKFFAEMWDAILNVGRPQTLQQQLAAVEARLRETAGSSKEARSDDEKVGAYFGPEAKKKANGEKSVEAARAELMQRAENLREQLRIEARLAAAESDERRRVEKSTEDDKRAGQERGAIAAADIARVKDQLASLTGAYADAERIVEQQRQAGLVDERTYWAAKRSLIDANAQAQVAALEEENRVLERQKVQGAERIQRDQQVASNVAEMARVRAKAAADTVIANAQETAAYARLTQAMAQYQAQLQENEAARARQHQRELATLGRGDSARALAGRQNAIDDRYIQQRNQLDSERRTGQISQADYEQRLQMLRDFYKRALEAEVAYQREIQQAQGDGTLGMQRALENYADRARDVASQTEQLFTRAFQGMEDGLVDFAMTGKMKFHEFAQSVIADLVRIYVRQQILGLFTQVAGAFAGAASGGGTSGSGDPFAVTGEVMHGGGVVGVDRFTTRTASASSWANAPRYHNGLKSDEYYAILQRGESVLTPAQMRQLAPASGVGVASAGGAAAVNVHLPVTLVNNSGTPMRATATQRQDGGVDVLLEAIESAVAANVSSGVGPLNGAIQSRYGLQPTMAGR